MTPIRFEIEGDENGAAAIDETRIVLTAADRTDWFFPPDGGDRSTNVVRVVHETAEPVFVLAAKVRVDFRATYDAGALFVSCGEESWAKLAFERSAAGEPTIVSVVTRGTSDDADGPVHPDDHVWLRCSCDGRVVAFHFSGDGRTWRFLRVFTLPGIGDRPIRIGLCAQSPTGRGTTAIFSDVTLTHERIANLRDGS